jgi:hypothetical protein
MSAPESRSARCAVARPARNGRRVGRGARVRDDKSRPQEPLPAPPAGVVFRKTPSSRAGMPTTVPCARVVVKTPCTEKCIWRGMPAPTEGAAEEAKCAPHDSAHLSSAVAGDVPSGGHWVRNPTIATFVESPTESFLNFDDVVAGTAVAHVSIDSDVHLFLSEWNGRLHRVVRANPTRCAGAPERGGTPVTTRSRPRSVRCCSRRAWRRWASRRRSPRPSDAGCTKLALLRHPEVML